MEPKVPWWRKDIDEMWAMALLGAVAIISVIVLKDPGKEVALVAVGGLAAYLGKGKTNSRP